jgi:hypothetical protein
MKAFKPLHLVVDMNVGCVSMLILSFQVVLHLCYNHYGISSWWYELVRALWRSLCDAFRSSTTHAVFTASFLGITNVYPWLPNTMTVLIMSCYASGGAHMHGTAPAFSIAG